MVSGLCNGLGRPLDQANRHSRFQESDLKGENLARPVVLTELKKQWLAARERAERLWDQLPAEELGIQADKTSSNMEGLLDFVLGHH